MNKPRISIIAAIGEKRELGKDNQLLWHIPGELPRFKRITMGHPIIMGRKTFNSIGRVLPGRLNIVISRMKSYLQGPNLQFTNSLEEAILIAKAEEARSVKNSSQPKEIFIIGGGQIFEQAMPMVDRLYMTLVHQTFDADVFFPEYSHFTKVIEKEDHEDGGYKYTFLTLEK